MRHNLLQPRSVLRRLFLLVSSCIAFSNTPASELPENAILVDVIGHHSLEVERVLERFPETLHSYGAVTYFLPNDNVEQLSLWCKALNRRPEISSAHCMTINFGTKNRAHVIALVERGRDQFSKPLVPELKTPPVDLDPGLIELKQAHSKAIRAELNQGHRVNLRIEGGISVSDRASVRAIEKRIHEIVASRAAHILEVLESSASPAERATAAALLNWVGEPRYWVERAIPFVNDREPAVRNNITLALGNQGHAGNVSASQAIQLATSIAPLLHSSYPTDLNKGITLLHRLVKGNAIAFEDLPVPVREQVGYLAAVSVSENIGGPARDLIGLAP